jgi:hypothetical protein
MNTDMELKWCTFKETAIDKITPSVHRLAREEAQRQISDHTRQAHRTDQYAHINELGMRIALAEVDTSKLTKRVEHLEVGLPQRTTLDACIE